MCSYASSSTRYDKVAENNMLSRCSVLRQPPQHEADVLDEAEVEHAIRFVEHEHLHAAQAEHALLEEIDDAAGCADQHIHSGFELASLLVVVGAAEREPELVREMLTEDLRIGVDLHGELARRREHERARISVIAVRPGRRFETVKQCDQIRRGLAGSGLRLARRVLAVERDRQRLALNRRAVHEAGFGNRAL